MRDLTKARAFWVDALGALEHGAFGWPVGTAPADESLATVGTAAEVLLLRTDAAFLELFAFSSPVPAERASDAPGVSALTWACDDVDAIRTAALGRGGTGHPAGVLCPDGTPVRLVDAGRGPRGLVGVEVKVAVPSEFEFSGARGPVGWEVIGGASRTAPRPVDLGVNHVCLDVADAGLVREHACTVSWHHPVTESSGGLAAVCYGTTEDGVLVELLESRSPEAFFARTRLERG